MQVYQSPVKAAGTPGSAKRMQLKFDEAEEKPKKRKRSEKKDKSAPPAKKEDKETTPTSKKKKASLEKDKGPKPLAPELEETKKFYEEVDKEKLPEEVPNTSLKFILSSVPRPASPKTAKRMQELSVPHSRAKYEKYKES